MNWLMFFGLAAMLDKGPMTLAVLKPYLENIGVYKVVYLDKEYFLRVN